MAGQFYTAEYLAQRLRLTEMTVDQLKELAVFLMLETISVEPTVGGPIQAATVTLRNAFQRLTEDEIEELIQACQPKVGIFRKLLREIWEPNLPAKAIHAKYE